MKQSERLRAMAEFLENNDLEEVVSVRSSKNGLGIEVPFWDQCTPTQRRSIKLLFGPLEVRGTGSFKYLTGFMEYGETKLRCEVFGAYQCVVKETKEVETPLNKLELRRVEEQIATLVRQLETGHKVETKYEYTCTPTELLARDQEDPTMQEE